MSKLVLDSLLACPTEVHDEMRSDAHRVRAETHPIGVQRLSADDVLFLRNCCTCETTLAFEVDVDAQARETD